MPNLRLCNASRLACCLMTVVYWLLYGVVCCLADNSIVTADSPRLGVVSFKGAPSFDLLVRNVGCDKRKEKRRC